MEILNVKGLKVFFKKGRSYIKTISGIDLKIKESEIVGIAGESGSGKTVSMLALTNLLPESSSKVEYDSYKINNNEIKSEQISYLRGRFISYVFQDPLPSLDPMFTINMQLKEVYQAHEKIADTAFMLELLKIVGLDEPQRILKSYPHQLSGGMAQRIAITLALATDSKILVADEPTTALDATLRKGILELLKKLKYEKKLSIFFISHDLNQVFYISDQIYIFYAGRVIEEANRNELKKNPLHPYTVSLLKCLPKKDSHELYQIEGRAPDYRNLPSGCKFHPRCQHVMDICQENEPFLTEVKKNHFVRCFKSGNDRDSKC